MKISIFGSKSAKEVQYYFLHNFIVIICYGERKIIIVLVLILQFSLWTVGVLASEMVEILLTVKDWEQADSRTQHSVKNPELSEVFENLYLDNDTDT